MKKYMPLLMAAVIALAISGSRTHAQETLSAPIELYDPNPRHLWNRLHEALWVRVGPDDRVYGQDRVDPLLWSQTRHLLNGPSRNAAVQLLRDFLDKHGEKLIDDPLKRAVLQRDLWAIFDWVASLHVDEDDKPIGEPSPTMLRRLLAQAIARLALDPQTIEQLPDTYSAAVAAKQFAENFGPARPTTPFLPPDLFDPQGPWVCVGRNGSDIVAPAHARSFSRSSFQVFLKLPDGRQATDDYLRALSSFKEPFILQPLPNDGRFLPHPNPDLPQIPAGTQFALVRSALLIDSGLHLRATRIVESVQLRDDTGNYEFTFNRARLFGSSAGGLRAVAPEESDFSTNLEGSRNDVFESDLTNPRNRFVRQMPVVIKSCVGCHRHGVSLPSFNTFVGGFSPPGPELHPSFYDTRTTARGEAAAIRNKHTRYDWGVLEGLLSHLRESAPSPP